MDTSVVDSEIKRRVHYLTFIENNIKKYWDMPILSDIDGKDYTYGDIAIQVEKFHIIFDKVLLDKGDKVALCSKNSSNWAMAFLAITSYEAVGVPLLHDFSTDSVTHLIDHSECKMAFIDPDMWTKLNISSMPNLKYVFSMKDYSVLYNADNNKAFDDAVNNIDTLFAERYKSFNSSCVSYPVDNMDKLSIINYTSGTTSDPKGVMLTYRNISSNIQFGQWGIPNHPGDTIVSMLPLAHMFGLAFEFLYQLAGGSHVYFLSRLPSPKILFNSFFKVKPYMVITVPLVIEKIFKSAVFPVVNKQPVKTLLKVPVFERVIKKRIRAKLIDAFGGKIRSLIIGGAAINPEVEEWLKAIKMPYTVGYGMTECGPLIGYQNWRKFKKGSCGVCVHRMEVKIDSEDQEHIVGEILAKGDNVMMGYYKNPEATKSMFTEDGWMKTGDLGLIDEKGNIFIKGRIKNLILGANGQNIYPEEIEDKLNNQPYIVESVVVKRDRKIVALVFPDMDRVSQESLDANDLAKLMEENRVRLNLALPLYSRIAKIELRKEEFEKTPKKSIKRFLYK